MAGKDISFKFNFGRLNMRVCGLLQRNGKILTELGYDNSFFVLPGGRVTFGETAEEAIVREMREELHINVNVVRCLFVHQNFFDWIPGEPCHEIAFYFLVESEDAIPQESPFKNFDGTSTFHWKTTEEIKQVKFFPICLQNCIDSLPQSTQLIWERTK